MSAVLVTYIGGAVIAGGIYFVYWWREDARESFPHAPLWLMTMGSLVVGLWWPWFVLGYGMSKVDHALGNPRRGLR